MTSTDIPNAAPLEHEVEKQFSEAIAEEDFGYHDIPADGELHTFSFPKDKLGKKNGSAILIYSEKKIEGLVFDRRKGKRAKPIFTWKPNFTLPTFTDEEWEARAKATEKRAAAKKATQEEARITAINDFTLLPKATDENPYLERKHIPPDALRLPLRADGNALVIPVYNSKDDEFLTIQQIWSNGLKRFPPGATTTGGYTMAGPYQTLKEATDKNKRGPIIITEGFATAYAARKSDPTYIVVAALGVWNFRAVAKDVYDRFPLREIIIATDNDDLKPINRGVIEGTKVALEFGFKIAVSPSGDFWDLWDAEGPDAVKKCIDAAEAPPLPAVAIDDFIAYSPQHTYIYIPTREMWPSSSVNSRVPAVPLSGDNKMPASVWLDMNRAVEQMTWAPGEPMEIKDRLVADGGWFDRKGATCFNLYRPPTIVPGDASKAGMWIDLVKKVYPDDADHLIDYFAHCVQHPQIKINHAILMGGEPGIGKDTILEPLKRAVGPWNFQETTPKAMSSQFNGYLKCVVLRISELRDLGDVNRFSFYEQMKGITAAPPDVHRIDDKYMKAHYVLNCNATITTSNHKTDGIYLPPEDRRTYVMWSDKTKDDFSETDWNKIWKWYEDGGDRDVAAYLATKDISAFNPKKPPKKTEAFWAIANSSMAPEQSEFADVISSTGCPRASSAAMIAPVLVPNIRSKRSCIPQPSSPSISFSTPRL